MSLLICVVPVCPLRAEAAHKSEQTSQLLFGEVCELLEQTKDFFRVKVVYDNYEGWCQANQLIEVEEPQMQHTLLAAGWINNVIINNQSMHAPFGSSVGLLQNGGGKFGNYNINYNGNVLNVKETLFNEDEIKKYAFKFLNTSYLWGGRSVFGVDCSGFTQMVFKCFNVRLLRDAYQQATQGEAVGFLQEVTCGDLAFFDNEAGKITHVGILLDAEKIIHASGKVRVDAIDNLGIINSDTGRRTHNLRVIKHMV